VIEGTNRMHDLVAGIMAHARAARGQLERAPVDLGELVDEAARALKAAVEAAGATIEVDGALPTVDGDRDQLAQLVQNLLANAIKFHRPGQRPLVRVSAGHDQAAGRWWLAVADDGIGIDPPHRERVFHMFQRLNPRGDYPGSGVGLAVCERIVQRHGGRIWVDAAPGGGAVFTLEIPDRS
jgi:signal transduction histidine kinase